MKAIAIGTYYETLTFLRVKKAVFFTFIFPCFIYILFSMIWGNGEPEYCQFLLTGTAMMVTASDAIFSIGSIVVGYFHGGMSKFLKSIPNGFIVHMTSMILSRLLIIAVAVLLVPIVAAIKDGYQPSVENILLLLAGALLNAIIFSLISIVAAAFAKETSSYTSILNIVLYASLFVSDTFYPLSELNPKLGAVAQLNPISPSISLARTGQFSFIAIGWILLCIIIMLVRNPLKQKGR
ncbi:MAG: ABC transporter permease [Bacteroidales bacterium]|nr:ABC transporter permease [Bacteroidales bacterium]